MDTQLATKYRSAWRLILRQIWRRLL